MYTAFYQLDKNPFEINPDLSFLWLGAKHGKALSTLHYGILENKGFALLTGATGSGKTTLVQALTEKLDEDIVWAVIADPQLERVEFYNAIAKGVGLDRLFTSKVQFLLQFSQFLHKAHEEKKKVLLLVDDCHLLSQEMLEELRLLSNIEKADAKLINIFLVGQPEFKETLLEPKNRALNQRLSLKVSLQALNAEETGDYIRHRLKVAGTEEKVFDTKAILSIWRASLGLPRRINTLCGHALAHGATQNKRIIDTKMIEACVREMDQPAIHPGKEDSATAQGGNINFSHRNENGIAQPSPEIFSFQDGLLEKKYRYGWLKYVFGFLVIVVVGIYFGSLTLRSGDNSPEVLPQTVETPVVMQLVPQVSFPPTVMVFEEKKDGVHVENKDVVNVESKVVVLEENKNDMNVAKAAALKTLVQHVTVLNKPIKIKTLKRKEKVLISSSSARGAGLQGGESTGAARLATQEKPNVAAQPVPSGASLEPKKMVLALQPNVLKLTNAAAKEFDRFVIKLKRYPQAIIKVKGFVSAQSNSPENIKLSKERAEMVQKLLLANGLAAGQIEVLGLGNQEPIASNTTSEGRRKNRRVEIVIIDDGISRSGGN